MSGPSWTSVCIGIIIGALVVAAVFAYVPNSTNLLKLLPGNSIPITMGVELRHPTKKLRALVKAATALSDATIEGTFCASKSQVIHAVKKWHTDTDKTDGITCEEMKHKRRDSTEQMKTHFVGPESVKEDIVKRMKDFSNLLLEDLCQNDHLSYDKTRDLLLDVVQSMCA